MVSLSRRSLLAGAAVSPAGLGLARAAPAARLIARREMAVQVVDYGWRREAQMFDSAGPQGAVTNEIYTLETRPDHVRFRFQNGLTEGWTIAGATYAATAAAQSDPVDAGGAPVALAAVTFGNNGQDIALEDQQAAADAPTSLTLPAATEGWLYPSNGYQFRGRPALVFSDWMPFEAVARDDGGPGCLVMLRVKTADPAFTGVRPLRLHQQPLFQGTAARPWRALYVPGGDGLTGDYTDPDPLQDYLGNGLCCGVQAIGAVPGLTLLSVGDSVLMGGGEPQGYLGSVKRAADLMSTPALPVSHIEAAIYGCPSGAFLYLGEQAVRTNKVSCAFIQALSGNDGHTMEAAQKSFAGAVALADICVQLGTQPIFYSPGPPQHAGENPNLEAIHLATLAALQSPAAHGYPVLDLFAVLGTGGDDRTMVARAGIRSDDHVHLNSAGNTLVANAVVTMLRSLPVSTE